MKIRLEFYLDSSARKLGGSVFKVDASKLRDIELPKTLAVAISEWVEGYNLRTKKSLRFLTYSGTETDYRVIVGK